MSQITFRENFRQKLESSPEKHVFIVVIATKPDIIKQAPVYAELKKRGKLALLGHTGQHFDFNLSGGMLEEFGMAVDFNLNIEGSLCLKTAQIIERFGSVLEEIKKMGKEPVPIVHGDTTTASACANASWACGLAVVHNEAGIRTMTPRKEHYKKLLESRNLDAWFEIMKDKNNFERGSHEPVPEQFNTRSTEPAAGVFLAPHSLDAEFLELEGFPKERIFTVGNSVVDATRAALESAEKSTIFEKYPKLQEGFIRFCIHRRENCENEKRFRAIFDGMKRCVEAGENVLLISLFATEAAIDRFGLRGEIDLLKQRENFIYSPVWPFYGDVIAAMKKAKVCATDSGSMQEEMNEMGISTATLRFGSDRAETFFSGSNVIAPPIEGELIFGIIQKIIQENRLKNAPKIYGDSPAEKSADAVLNVLDRSGTLKYTEEMRLFN